MFQNKKQVYRNVSATCLLPLKMKNLHYTIKTKLGNYTVYTPDDINIDMVVKQGVDGYLSARELPTVVKALIKRMGFKLNLYNAKKLNKICGLTKK